jgi:aarF domain-containing kinase
MLSLFFITSIQRIGDVSKEIKRVRAQMEEDEQLATLMRGLRGQNLKDSQFAEDDVQLRLVEVFNFNKKLTE